MSHCSRCGAAFDCAMVDGAGAGQPCWCTTLPPLAALPDSDMQGARCWCPACLRAHGAASTVALTPPAAPD